MIPADPSSATPVEVCDSSAVVLSHSAEIAGTRSSPDLPEHTRVPQSSTTRLFFLFVLTLNFLFLMFSSGRVRTRDEYNADLQAESLATRGSTAIPQAMNFYFYGKLDRKGQPQPPYGPAHAAFLVPWYYAGRLLVRIVPGIPNRARDTFVDAVEVSSSATFAALGAGLIFLILTRLGLSTPVSLAAATMIALATPLLAYSAVLYSEALTSALLLGAVAALFHGGTDTAPSWREPVLAGILLGAMIWVRPAHLIATPVFIAGLLARGGAKSWRAARILAVIVAIFGLAYLWRNFHLFGNLFDFGYPGVAEGGKNLNSFETPLLIGLRGFLLSPGKSVFLFAPPLLLALAGGRKLAHLDKGLAVVAGALPLVYLSFYATYTQWEGGYCVGPRYLVPAISVMCLALGPALQNAGTWVRRAAVVLFAAGFFVQAINMATSFLEDQANGTYYDSHFNYRMDYSPLLSMGHRLIQYATSPGPAPAGLGFDRWFVFLHKAGVANGTNAAFFALEILGFAFCGIALLRAMRFKVSTSQL